MKKYLYVVRHGETDYNARRIFQGQQCDIPLNDTGRRQAHELIAKLKNKKIDAIYCSPLKRARETADIIAAGLKLPVKIHQGLIEGNFGVAEGVPAEEIRNWPVYALWCNNDEKYDDVGFEKGETKRQIRTRVINALNEICRQEEGEHILIVAHGAVSRVLNWHAGNYLQGIPNGTVSEFIYQDDKLSMVKEKLLLLSCCAPCSCAVIKTLAEQNKDFSVVFYNPNIRPLAEYQKRRDENERVCKLYGVDFIELEYDNERWCALTKGLENEPERGKRCSICFYMRLKRVMEYALANGFTAVSSVLGVSRWKNLAQVNNAAITASDESGIAYLEIEGRKNGMQELRARLIKELNLYNQNYCGCKPQTNNEQ